MSASLIQLSSRGAFSYHWNKGIDNDESCFIRTVKSAVGFFKGLFGGYAVSVAEITAIFKDDNHKGSICYKEYCIKMKNRNAEIVNDSVSGEQRTNDAESENKNNAKNKEGTNSDKEEILKSQTDKSTERNGVSVKKPSIDKLVKLMKKENFKSSDKHFSKETLKLLGADDALRLFLSAVNLATQSRHSRDFLVGALNFENEYSDIVHRLLSETECDQAFSSLVGYDKADVLCFFACCGSLDRLGSLLVGDNGMCGNEALMCAVSAGNVDCVKLLLVKGADINVHSIANMTPLYLAVLKGDIGCLNALIIRAAIDVNYASVLITQEDIDVNYASNYPKETPLECACRIGSKECLAALLAHFDINKSGMNLLSKTLRNGSLECLELLLLDDDIYVKEAKEAKGNSDMPISYVLKLGIPLSVLKTFLHAHARDLGQEAFAGCTLLRAATIDYWGFGIELLNELLSYDLIRDQINRVDRDSGQTVLHYAAEKCNIGVMRALLAVPEIKINIKVRNNHRKGVGLTPLELLEKSADRLGYEECKVLLEPAVLKQEQEALDKQAIIVRKLREQTERATRKEERESVLIKMNNVMDVITSSLKGKKWEKRSFIRGSSSSKLFVMQAASVKLEVKIEIEEFRGSEI